MDYLNSINSGLFLIYGLVALLIILIIVILLVDRKESKRETDNLFNTLNMKVIKDVDNFDTSDIEVLESENIKTSTDDDFSDISFDDNLNSARNRVSETVKMMDFENFQDYHEDELDKTQAQLRVESITRALEDAKVDEKIEEDKYEKFEQEQEESAIISYEELMKSYDRLYTENEKIQYVDDDTIPINIKELYELGKSEMKNDEVFSKADDLVKKVNNNYDYVASDSSSFKSSPYISPVYGIQNPPVRDTIKRVDNDIEDTTVFLNNLKELKNNLD